MSDPLHMLSLCSVTLPPWPSLYPSFHLICPFILASSCFLWEAFHINKEHYCNSHQLLLNILLLKFIRYCYFCYYWLSLLYLPVLLHIGFIMHSIFIYAVISVYICWFHLFLCSMKTWFCFLLHPVLCTMLDTWPTFNRYVLI